MADKIIMHPAALLAQKHKSLTDKIAEVDNFVEKETRDQTANYLKAHMDMYQAGEKKAGEKFKGKHGEALVKDNEDAMKEIVSDMFLSYLEKNHAKKFEHFKEELKTMDTDQKYQFAINAFDMHHLSTNRDGEAVKTVGDIVKRYKTNEKATVKDLINEIGTKVGDYAQAAAQKVVGTKVRRKVAKIEEDHEDEIIPFLKYTAAVKGHDLDSSGNFHIQAMQEGAVYNMHKAIMGGLDERGQKQYGLKTLKAKEEPVILKELYKPKAA